MGKNRLPKWACFIEDFKVKYPKLDWKEHAGSRHYYDELNKLSDEEKEGLGIDEKAAHRWYVVDGDGKARPMNDAEKAAFESQMQGKMEQIADEITKSGGTLSSEIDGIIKGFVKPKSYVNYKRHIRQVAGNSDTFKLKGSRLKENQRFPDQARIVKKQLNKIIFYVDQSGSMGQKALEAVINEGYHLKKMYEVKFFAFDTQVIGEIKVKKDCLERRACGGTEPICCIEHFEKSDYTTAIIFTDGHFSPVRTSNKKILWIIDPEGTLDSTTNQQNVIRLPKDL